MDLHIVFLGFHLLGFALGLGGATISDITFLQAISDRRISDQQYATLKILSRVIWVGLIVLIISGLSIFGLIYNDNNGSLPLLGSPRWQAKLTMVVIVLINGFVFMKMVFPTLKNLVNQQLSRAVLGSKLWLMAVTGTISIVSWYSILVVSILPRTVRPPLYYFLGCYLILIILGTFISANLIKRKLQ